MAINNNITTKFSVDVSDLKKGISEANQQIKLANATFKSASAGLEDWQKSADGIKAKITQLTSVLEAQKSKLSSYREQLQRQQQAYDENGERAEKLKAQLQELADNGVSKTSKEYKALESELNAVEKEQIKNESAINSLNVTILNQEAAVKSTQKELNNYETALADVDKEQEQVEESAKDVGDEITEAAEDSAKAEGKFSSLGKTLAKGVAAGFTALATAAAGAVAGLAKLSVSSAENADEILTLSQKTGMSTEALQGYKYAAELIDTSLETMTGSLAKNIRSMTSAASGTGAAAEAYKALGVSVTDANGNLRDSESVYWETIDALGQVSDETQRDSLAMQVFGKSAQELNPLIEKGSEAVKAYTEEAKEMGAVMSGEQLENLGAFDDAMQRLKAGAEAGKNALGTLLLPVLQELADTALPLLGEFNKAVTAADGDFSKISESIGGLFGNITNAILQKLPELLKLGTTIIQSLLSVLISNLPMILSTVTDVAMQVTQMLVSMTPQLLSALFVIAQNLIAQLPSIVTNFALMLAQFLTENLPIIIQGGLDLLMGIIEAIPLLIKLLGPEIPKIVQQTVSLLISMLPVLIKGAMQLFIGIVRGLKDILPLLWNLLPTIISGLLSGLSKPAIELFTNLWAKVKSIFGKVKEFFKDKFGSAWKAVKDVFRNVGKFFGDVWTKVKDKFSALGTKIGDAISGSVKAGINGILSTIERVINSGINLINGAIGLINKIPGVSIGTTSQLSLPRLARGAVIDRPTLAEIGEAGAEAVVPLENNTKWIKNVASAMAESLKQVNTTYNYTQVINSPKPLTRLEIYRQTRNLLAYKAV